MSDCCSTPPSVSIRSLVAPDHPALWKVAEKVTDFTDPKLGLLISDMHILMWRHGGLGIAAPQVGESLRVFLFTAHYPEEVIVAINPEIVWSSLPLLKGAEACLTWPNRYQDRSRSHRITVAFYDTKGERKEMELWWRDARVFCHELDHLDGICIFPKPQQVV
jgi:peptide deformylase